MNLCIEGKTMDDNKKTFDESLEAIKDFTKAMKNHTNPLEFNFVNGVAMVIYYIQHEISKLLEENPDRHALPVELLKIVHQAFSQAEQATLQSVRINEG